MKTATKSTKKTGSTAAPKAQPALVAKQPQSKNEAAVRSGLFLHTDDKWSLAYFDSGDLHCEERELFG